MPAPSISFFPSLPLLLQLCLLAGWRCRASRRVRNSKSSQRTTGNVGCPQRSVLREAAEIAHSEKLSGHWLQRWWRAGARVRPRNAARATCAIQKPLAPHATQRHGSIGAAGATTATANGGRRECRPPGPELAHHSLRFTRIYLACLVSEIVATNARRTFERDLEKFPKAIYSRKERSCC